MNAPKSIALTRRQLYTMIWVEPTRTVATRLGISDVGLAKICRKLHIPALGAGTGGRTDSALLSLPRLTG